MWGISIYSRLLQGRPIGCTGLNLTLNSGLMSASQGRIHDFNMRGDHPQKIQDVRKISSEPTQAGGTLRSRP